jgi:transposase
MARKLLIPDDVLEIAAEVRDEAKTIQTFRRGVTALLITDPGNNYTARDVGRILGISRKTVFEDLDKLKRLAAGEPEDPKQGAGGRHNAFMTIDEETRVLEPWEEKAAQGEPLSVPELHEAFNSRVGKTVPKSTVYRILSRHGWRKVKQAPNQPPEVEVKEEVKKIPPNLWLKVK